MKIVLKVISILFLLINFLTAQIILDNEQKEIALLNKSEIYFDKTNKTTIHSLIQNPKLFKKYDKEYINNGVHKYPVWVKFTLFNNTSKSIQRILSLDEFGLEYIELYTVKDNAIVSLQKDGFLNKKEFKGILMPYFKIEIPSFKKREYYLKVLTPNYALSFKALLSTYEEFLFKDIKNQLILAIFIALLVMVIIYNLILFFLTKDSIYFYYALFVLGILAPVKFHYLLWLYIFPMHDSNVVLTEMSLKIYYTNFTALTILLFTQNFLQTKQYPKIHKFLNFSIAIVIIVSLLHYQNVIPLYFLLLISSFIIGFYALFKRNKNALYFLFGSGLSILAWIIAVLDSFNIWSAKYDFYYIIQTLFTIEVFLFSYAISFYIRRLNKQKEELSQKLIEQKENENIKLEKKVKEKTHNLNKELKTNKFLLQELNHRVKNNMQFITSLYALKLGDNIEVQEKLQDIERKVQAMSQVHQMLYSKKDLSKIKADDYFETIIHNIKESFNYEDIKFNYNIQINLDLDEAIYCGLIVNELVTNAIKYAFDNNKGEITISLTRDQEYKYLTVTDNGVGIKNFSSSGFGHILIEILAIEQLQGEVNIDTTMGTQIEIKYKS